MHAVKIGSVLDYCAETVDIVRGGGRSHVSMTLMAAAF
jgi:hypothetical protein